MSRRIRLTRRLVAGSAGVALVGSGLLAGGVTAVAAPEAPAADPSSKITAEVQEQLQEKGAANVWISFSARPDMSAYASLDWEARGEAVYEALTTTARDSQAATIAQLDEAGLDYSTYWGANVIKVQGADTDLLAEVTSTSAVKAVYPEFTPVLETPEQGTDEVSPSAIEWGVNDINAPAVWDQFGTTGEGIVVASLDTGVDYDHPALVGQYRGNNGDGTFTHDYNWFDVSGTSDEPIDTDPSVNHGTHVTGTMVGDDGGANQIGVAPGAQWIASNGCCPSDQALLDGMQWFLAPTDLDGANPDPDQRPHIVNNSWGTTLPSNDPFGEEIQENWEAAGIFGMWANGNSGPACNTSGSPGSRILNYSVGNYDINHNPSGTSGRGAGQDGEIKPNIAAPGTNIRSAADGGGYRSISGTSMASPHASGAVALVWSAAPALVGDIEGTKALLDGSAIDNPDDQCGGTDADNNVFGEGRLDALALVSAAPTEDAATLSGTVTDEASGDPLEGATVEVTGDNERNLTTGEDGTYSALLPAGAYDVEASAFGYVTETESVDLPAAGEETVDFALAPAETSTLTGTVTDGSGQGWPLYALVQVEGTPISTYTDPITGEYSVEVPEGDWTVTIGSQVPGYSVATEDITVSGDAVLDAALVVDINSCTAPGYSYVTDGVITDFEGGLPEGWTVESNSDTATPWEFDDATDRGNLTGGEGQFAMADSDAAGSGSTTDTQMYTQVLDFTDNEAPAVGFKHHFRSWINDQTVAVEVSIDGGETWEAVFEPTATITEEVVVQLPQAAGQAETQVRWNYVTNWGYYWQVDDVFVGTRTCDPTVEGGLLAGFVTDADGEGIVGATVTHDEVPEVTATTVATPDDENIGDGFYWLFSPPGTQPFTAEAANYGTVSESVDVADDDTTQLDFTLGSASLSADPGEFTFTLAPDETDSDTLTITNDGTEDAEISIREVREEFVPEGGAPEARPSTDATEVIRLDAPTSFAASGTSDAGSAPADVAPAAPPWEGITDLPAVNMDNEVVNIDGTLYSLGGTDGTAAKTTVDVYDTATEEWTAGPALPAPRNQLAAASVGGVIYATGGWEGEPTSTTWALDPAAGTWTDVAESPIAASAQGVGVVDGLMYVVGGCSTGACTPMLASAAAYDPAADTWTEIADYPEAVAFATCGGFEGVLVCAGGNDGASATAGTYAYDPAGDSWTELAPAPADFWAASGSEASGQLVIAGGVQAGSITNAAHAYDPAADAWTTIEPAEAAVYRGGASCGFFKIGGDVGNFTPQATSEVHPDYPECTQDVSDVLWLEADPVELTVPAGESADVDVNVDSTGLELGTYTSGLRFSTNTPNGLEDVPVTLVVTDDEPPVNEAPVVEDLAVTTSEDTAVDLTVEASDPDGDELTFTTTEPENGSLTGEGPEYTYTPDAGFTGEDTFDVTASDGELEGTGTVTVTVEPGEEPPPGSPEVTRVEGGDRYGTAVAISELWEPGVDTVYIATGTEYADALTGSALAAAGGTGGIRPQALVGGPVLLVQTDHIPRVVETELERIDAQSITILGGSAAVSDGVAEDLVDYTDGTVLRLEGEDRYETAALIAAQFEDADEVYIATGQDYPDALAAAARAGALDAPVLLVKSDHLPTITGTALDALEPDSIRLLGGTSAVNGEVEDLLSEWAPVERVQGSSADGRYGTAAALAEDYDAADILFVSTGQDWPDALAGSAWAGSEAAPMLLTQAGNLPTVTETAVQRLGAPDVVVLGGDSAINQTVVDELEAIEYDD